MTDKVQKIRNEVERLKNELVQEREKGYGSDVDDACILELQNVLTYIDSLQEEPVSEDLEEKITKCYKSRIDLMMTRKQFGEIIHRFTEWQKEQMRGEEPVSEELKEAAKHYLYGNILYDDVYVGNPTDKDCIEMFKAGAEWQKANLWRPTDGDDLPEIDREVVALLDNGKVVFAHRPPEYWDGKDIVTGKVTRNYPKTYDKGGWNIPNVKWWLDCSLPKEIEL